MIMRDRMTGVSKGMAIIEFHTVEFSSYALSQSGSLSLDNAPLKVSFARDNVVKSQLMIGAIPPPMPSFMQQLAPPGSWPAGIMAQAPISGASTAPTIPVRPVIASKVKPQWPPVFETNGASYVFQTQSGYFWEPLSQFYYCPKSKLYYNTIDGVYYSYDATANPSFVKFIPPLPAESYESALAANTMTTNDSASDDASARAALALEAMVKKPVIISLGASANKSKAKATAGFSATKKTISNDIAKWGSLQTSADEEEDESVAKKADVPSSILPVASITPTSLESALLASAASLLPAPILPSSVAVSSKPVVSATTAVASAKAKSSETVTSKTETKESFICHVCRRQFNSAAILARHEQESALHKENLAKAAAAAASADDGQSSATYRDRASERRAIHGTSADPMIPIVTGAGRGTIDKRTPPGIHAPTFAPVVAQPVVDLSSDLSNPGNQLLRKMGWTEGEGLGKESQGRELPIALEVSASASSIGIGASDRSIPTLNYNDPNSYRESVLQATKARFEQISGQGKGS
jgi:RNA-binding protein 5/10